MHGTLDNELDPDSRREVKDGVAVIDQLGQERTMKDCIDNIMETRVVFEMFDITNKTRGQVVDDHHLVAFA
jgi:hypothetical protein